jgi:hypothetical protein
MIFLYSSGAEIIVTNSSNDIRFIKQNKAFEDKLGLKIGHYRKLFKA